MTDIMISFFMVRISSGTAFTWPRCSHAHCLICIAGATVEAAKPVSTSLGNEPGCNSPWRDRRPTSTASPFFFRCENLLKAFPFYLRRVKEPGDSWSASRATASARPTLEEITVEDETPYIIHNNLILFAHVRRTGLMDGPMS